MLLPAILLPLLTRLHASSTGAVCILFAVLLRVLPTETVDALPVVTRTISTTRCLWAARVGRTGHGAGLNRPALTAAAGRAGAAVSITITGFRSGAATLLSLAFAVTTVLVTATFAVRLTDCRIRTRAHSTRDTDLPVTADASWAARKIMAATVRIDTDAVVMTDAITTVISAAWLIVTIRDAMVFRPAHTLVLTGLCVRASFEEALAAGGDPVAILVVMTRFAGTSVTVAVGTRVMSTTPVFDGLAAVVPTGLFLGLVGRADFARSLLATTGPSLFLDTNTNDVTARSAFRLCDTVFVRIALTRTDVIGTIVLLTLTVATVATATVIMTLAVLLRLTGTLIALDTFLAATDVAFAALLLRRLCACLASLWVLTLPRPALAAVADEWRTTIRVAATTCIFSLAATTISAVMAGRAAVQVRAADLLTLAGMA